MYLGTKGLYGKLTDYYPLIQAAKYLNCKPWELAEQSTYWQDIAHKCMQADAQAQDIIRQRG